MLLIIPRAAGKTSRSQRPRAGRFCVLLHKYRWVFAYFKTVPMKMVRCYIVTCHSWQQVPASAELKRRSVSTGHSRFSVSYQ